MSPGLCSVSKTVSASASWGELDWFDDNVWNPIGVPNATDDVLVTSIPCNDTFGSFLSFETKSTVYTVKSLRFEVGSGTTCRPVLRIQSSVLRIEEDLSMNNYDIVLVLTKGASLIVGGNFFASDGTLMGHGQIRAKSLSFVGANLSPGISGPACPLCRGGIGDNETGILDISTTKGSRFNNSAFWFKIVVPGQFDQVRFSGGLALVNNVRINPISSKEFVGASLNLIVFDSANGTLEFVVPSLRRRFEVFAAHPALLFAKQTGIGVSLRSVFPWMDGCSGCGADEAQLTDPFPMCGSSGTLSITVGFSECSSFLPVSVNACASSLCVHGDCSQVFGGCVCHLQNGFGWSGDQCDVPVCAGDCFGAAHASCTQLSGGSVYPSCVCTPPWSGSTCETVTCSPACSANGTCIASGAGSRCECASGFDGETCTEELVIGTCARACDLHGSCNTTLSVCQCDMFYSGSSCSIAECPSQCSGNGVCLGGDAVPHCECVSGFNGTGCELAVCANGTGDCENGGSCFVEAFTRKCSCPVGFSGPLCQIRLGTFTTAPSDNSAMIGIAVGVTLGVLVLGLMVALTIFFVHKYRVRHYTKTTNASLKDNHMAQMRAGIA